MSEIQVNTINEYTGANGVTIDGVLVKDGQVDGKDVSSLVSAGLVLIDNYSFSAVTTFSRDNVFSSTYKNYLFQMNMDSASVTGDTNINFRASSSDYTSATYDWSTIYNVSNGTTVAVTKASNDTKLNGLAYMESTGSGLINSYIIANPNETKTTTLTGTANRFSGTDVVLGLFGGSTGVTNSFDGYTVTRISGTMTGSVKIFGIIDS
jgi:hypothetical protein